MEQKYKVEQIFTKNYARLCAMATAILHDSSLAQDAVQEGWIRLHKAKQLDTSSEEKLEHLILITVRHAAYNIMRKGNPEPIEDSILNSIPDTSPSPQALLQGFHNRKAKIIKGDICEERGHRRLMRDEGETKLTPQEQSLNEEIEKLQDQWPYLMNEIFFIDYLKNPTYERGLAAKSKILVCFNDELLAAFLSAYKKANISEQQEMLTILKEISFRGGAVERDETDTEVTRKNLEKLENALNSEVEHTSDAVKKFYANRHLETVKQIRQKFLNTREM